MGELVQEQFNLGRALVRLGLERLILGADLSSRPLAERASIANGILKGVLEKGDWQRALRLMYAPGVVSSLYDGDRKSFTESVIEVSKTSEEDTLDEDTRQLILKEWAPEDVYKLAVQSTLQEEKARRLFECVKDRLSEEQVKNGCIMFGERAIRNDKFQGAHHYFKEAGDVQRLNEVYDKLIKNADKFSIEFLIDAADNESTSGKTEELDFQRIIAIIRTLLKNKKLQKEIHYRKVDTLYRLGQIRQLLNSEQEKGLIDLIAPHLSGCELENRPNEKLKLAWALTHTRRDDEPAFAYRILKEFKHEGPEVLEAALNGLINHEKRAGGEYIASRMRLSLKEIEDKDLKAIFESAPLEIKAAIAEHLNDKATMPKLSKEFYQRRKEDGSFLEKAYELAFAAGEASDKKYIHELRTELVERELKKESLCYCFFWLNDKDVEGQTQAYNAVFKKDPESAFKLAKKIDDEKLIQQAREAITKKSPERAFDYFRRSGDYDLQGIELALNALAEKYSVSKETLQKTLQPAIQKDSQF